MGEVSSIICVENFCARRFETGNKFIVRADITGFIKVALLVGKNYLVGRDIDLVKFFLLRHFDKRAVIDLFDLLFRYARHQKQVKKNDNEQRNAVIEK